MGHGDREDVDADGGMTCAANMNDFIGQAVASVERTLTAIAAARDGAPGLPVVMIIAGDPVGAELMVSPARPGRDLTGTSAAGEEVLAKHVEPLSTAGPKLRRVSVLINSAYPANAFFFDAMPLCAKTPGLQLDRIDVAAERELD